MHNLTGNKDEIFLESCSIALEPRADKQYYNDSIMSSIYDRAKRSKRKRSKEDSSLDFINHGSIIQT